MSPTLTLKNANPNVVVMEHIVKGPVIERAKELRQELQKGSKKAFTKVIDATIGNSHFMGQVPITFIRQLIALVTYPRLMQDPHFPEDVKARAHMILQNCGKSVGSYSEPVGIEIIRRHVAEYLERRDGIPSDWRDVVLTSGASDGIKGMLRLFCTEENGKRAGIMVPIPQYPLYSSAVSEAGMYQIQYYLDGERNWELSIDELQRALSESRKYCNPRALIVTNPGNPTGRVFTRENMEEIIRFAYRENLFLMADEVYQENIYDENCEFISFRKVLYELGDPYSSMELVSINSVSKGYAGECGLRGGYMELLNVDPAIRLLHYKVAMTMLCPTTLGQVCMESVVNPPREGEESYDLFQKEKNGVIQSLKLRAKMVSESLQNIDGLSCSKIQGAMYAFPRLDLPPKALEEAKKSGISPDELYCLQLLEETGICIAPGSCFGQKPGIYYFRLTILPQPEDLRELLDKLVKFHKQFMEHFSVA